MQRLRRIVRSAALPVLAFVMLLCCGAADAQEERALRYPASERYSDTTLVATEKGEITPPDVFAHVALLRDELELIRSAMGKPTNTQSKIGVTDVAPREVFFQARTLFRKTDNLCFEIVRTRATLPETPTGEIHPSHVWSVVDAALERIRLVKAKLSITEQARRHSPVAGHSPTDVFRSIVQANRQLNLLLDHERSLGELFRQVTVGVSYVSRLLSRFPEAERIPAAPSFEPDADLRDVHDRLLECFARVHAIALRSGLKMMSFSPSSLVKDARSSSELYDLATIIVSEVAYLHATLKDIRPPHAVYDPGDKLPAQVYGRAGILAIQLEELQRLVNENPDSFRVSGNGPSGANGGGELGGDR